LKLWKRSTEFHRNPNHRTWALFAFLLALSCSTYRTTSESLDIALNRYAGRAAFGWKNLSTFLLKGRARLEGRGRVAGGRFVLWGDPRESLLRGDFFGPDGKPVVSFRGDSTGVTVYCPRDEYAFYCPGGLPLGEGVLSSEDLLFLVRTGFPLHMEPWQMVETAEVDAGEIIWIFEAGSGDTMLLKMNDGVLFPESCSWKGGGFTIDAASPHDEYRAWPWKWEFDFNGENIIIELTEVNFTEVPDKSIWSLFVPFHVDTMDVRARWIPSGASITK